MAKKIRKEAEKRLLEHYRLCGSDSMEHMLSQNLGGPGYYDNSWVQDAQFNSAAYNSITNKITSFLRNAVLLHPKRTAKYTVIFTYNDPQEPNRAAGIYHGTTLKDNEETTIYSGFIENQNHFQNNLQVCKIEEENHLKKYYSSTDPDKRRSCRPTPGHSTNYGDIFNQKLSQP